jgi:hypothetical protein
MDGQKTETRVLHAVRFTQSTGDANLVEFGIAATVARVVDDLDRRSRLLPLFYSRA